MIAAGEGTHPWIGLAASLGLCFGAALVGGIATASSVRTWYPSLAKPAWTPPSWLFGPVWTALYAMMAVAAWIVWRRTGSLGAARGALGWFAVQLVLNAAWSVAFFGLRSPGAALLDIVLLWGSIVATIVAFFGASPAASALLVPYLAWVSFAGVLNFAIWRLNR